MSNTILDKFNTECTAYINSELNTRLLASSSSSTDKSASCQHYFNEYQRCIDKQMNFVNYINEQQASLDALKSCETAIDTFTERLKAIHEYELKQIEVFEQILHELTKIVGTYLFFLLQRSSTFIL
jgi:5,10-methylenetetrahydrofolate reductase